VSQEYVERVRAFLGLWNGRKWRFEDDRLAFEQVFFHDAATALIDPNTVYVDDVFPDHAGEEFRGLDGTRRASKGWTEDCEWLLVELNEVIDAGERVVSIHDSEARMRHTGMEFAGPIAYLWTFRESKLLRYEAFRDVDTALKAAGVKD